MPSSDSRTVTDRFRVRSCSTVPLTMSLNRKDDNPDDRAALRHSLTQLPAGASEVFPQAQVRALLDGIRLFYRNDDGGLTV